MDQEQRSFVSPARATRRASAFLVCDSCGYSCLLQGSAAREAAAQAPICPGCQGLTRVVWEPTGPQSHPR